MLKLLLTNFRDSRECPVRLRLIHFERNHYLQGPTVPFWVWGRREVMDRPEGRRPLGRPQRRWGKWIFSKWDGGVYWGKLARL